MSIDPKISEMEVAGSLVLGMMEECEWEGKPPEEMAKEIATAYRVIYAAIRETKRG
jgi:hypothetical protein